MNKIYKALNKLAKDNGYINADSLLMDYGFIPTVLTPKHKKIEIVKLFIDFRKGKRNTRG